MSEVVKGYYEQHAQQEWNRLTNPYSQIEFRSMLALIERYFPAAGHVIDIGCGPGRYSIELLKKGFNTTLFELSQTELNLAAQKISELGFTAEDYICGDARNLEALKSAYYDAALVLGPLYHILDEAERRKLILETARILKPGGVALFGYINSWGSLKAGVSEFSETYRDIKELYAYLHEQKLDENKGFTECYFTVPPTALEEVGQNGFDILSYAGAEGFLSGLQTDVFRLYREDKPVYDNLLQAAAEYCEAPQFRDATEHLVIVGKRSFSRLTV